MDEAMLRLLLEQQTEFLSQQNASTHEKIDRLTAAVNSHVADDAEVHKVVVQHSAYWSLMLYVVGSLFVGGVAVAFAVLK